MFINYLVGGPPNWAHRVVAPSDKERRRASRLAHGSQGSCTRL